MKRVSIFLALVVSLVSGTAFSTTINWTSSNFNTSTQTFAGVTANNFSWSGNGYFHSHSSSVTVTSTLELLLDGVWTAVASGTTNTVSSNSGNQLASVYGNVSFASALVTGARLLSSPHQNQSYHSVGSSDSFTLSYAAVSEPGTALLMALGLAGLAARRMKKA